MHFRLRELANLSNPPLYPNINIDNDVTTRSLTGSSKHIKSKFLPGYSLHRDIGELFVSLIVQYRYALLTNCMITLHGHIYVMFLI